MSEAPTDLPPRLIAAATYVLEGEYACHECGCIVPVFGLMPIGPFDRRGNMLLDGNSPTNPTLARLSAAGQHLS